MKHGRQTRCAVFIGKLKCCRFPIINSDKCLQHLRMELTKLCNDIEYELELKSLITIQAAVNILRKNVDKVSLLTLFEILQNIKISHNLKSWKEINVTHIINSPEKFPIVKYQHETLTEEIIMEIFNNEIGVSANDIPCDVGVCNLLLHVAVI